MMSENINRNDTSGIDDVKWRREAYSIFIRLH